MLTRSAVLIATFKPKPKPPQAIEPSGAQPTQPVKPSAAAIAKEMRFDISLIRGSLIIDLLSHSLVTLSPAHASQALFVGATAMSSFGAGLVPAANSLALCIMQSRGEDVTGKLFGAFSVLQAVGQMILGVRLRSVFSPDNSADPISRSPSCLVSSTARPSLRSRRRSSRLQAAFSSSLSRCSACSAPTQA